MASSSAMGARSLASHARCAVSQSGSLFQNRTREGPGHSSLWRRLPASFKTVSQASGTRRSAESADIIRSNVRCRIKTGTDQQAGVAKIGQNGLRCSGNQNSSGGLGKRRELGARVECATYEAVPAGGELEGESVAEIDRAVILNTLTASSAAIADPIMSMVDTLFVGRLGVIPLSALGPNSVVFNAVFLIMSFTGGIVTAEIVGNAHAKGDVIGMQRAILTSVWLSVIVGALGMGALLAFGPQLMSAIGTQPDMMADTLLYLRIRASGVPASLLLLVFQAVYRATLDLRTPAIIVVLCGILNGILDPIMMFSWGWGIAGAAIATSLSQWAGVAMFAWLMLRHKTFAAPAPAGRAQERVPKWQDYKHYLQDCSGLLFRALTIIAIYSFAGVVATRLGSVNAAGYQLVNNLQMFQLTILWMFLEVGQSMVVNALGRRGKRLARLISDRVILWSVIASIGLAGATWGLRGSLPRLFIQDDAVLKVVATAMLPCCAMILMGWNNALEGILIGAGDTAYVVSSFLPAAGTGLVMLAYTLVKGGSLAAIWWSLAVYYVLLTLLYSIRYWVPQARVYI